MTAASHDTAAPEIPQSILLSNLFSDRPNLFQTQSLYLNYLDLLLSPTNTNTIPTTASIGTGHQSWPVLGSVDLTVVVTPVLGVIVDLGVIVERGVIVDLGVIVVDTLGVIVTLGVTVTDGVAVGVGVGVAVSSSTFGLASTS